MHRGLFYFVLCWHFTNMLAYNVSSTIKGSRQLTGETAPGFLPGIQQAAAALTSFRPARMLAHAAGTATGYGFFAPQVGSSFQLHVSLVNAVGTPYGTIPGPALENAHSQLRYHSMLNRMQYLLDDTADTENTVTPSLARRKAQAIAHCVALRLARRRWREPAGPLRCEVYVYGTPSLRQYATQRPYRVLVYRYDINQPSVL